MADIKYGSQTFQLGTTADVLGLSIATVKRDWAVARLFLQREIAAARDEVTQPRSPSDNQRFRTDGLSGRAERWQRSATSSADALEIP